MKANDYLVTSLVQAGISRLGPSWGCCSRTRSIMLLIYAMMSVLPLSGQRSEVTKQPARDFYISPDGSDLNAGTEEAPFSSFKKADSVVQAGDTVHVQPGTYVGY